MSGRPILRKFPSTAGKYVNQIGVKRRVVVPKTTADPCVMQALWTSLSEGVPLRSPSHGDCLKHLEYERFHTFYNPTFITRLGQEACIFVVSFTPAFDVREFKGDVRLDSRSRRFLGVGALRDHDPFTDQLPNLRLA